MVHHLHHNHTHKNHEHSHEYKINNSNEKRTLITIVITFIAMIMEIYFGYISNSMSLLSDGYHMGTHVFALLITYITYRVNRKIINENKCKKINALGAYTSTLFLGVSGLHIIKEVIERLIEPKPINFNEAIIIAIIGLVVNTICLLFFQDGQVVKHKDNKLCENMDCTCKDYNFRAAYYHILADALTSMFAILALIFGKYTGIFIADTVVAFFSACLILKWATDLFFNSVKVLVD